MFEIDARHQPYDASDLDAGTLLGLIAEDRISELQAVRKKLRLAYQYAVLHPATAESPGAVWSDARLPGLQNMDDDIGGEASPAIAAFAVESFAVSASVSRFAALALLADAVDLVHRLPKLWKKVETLDVEGWKARRVAELSRRLSFAAASWFDQHLAERGLYGWRSIELTLATATAKFHPELVRDRKGPRSKKDWDVRLHPGVAQSGTAGGTSELTVIGDSLDLERFHQLVCDEAERLKRAGDTDTLGQRKAKALGSLADRDHQSAGRAGRAATARRDHESVDNQLGGRAGSAASARRDHPPADNDDEVTPPATLAKRPGRRGLRVMVHVTLTDLLGLAHDCQGSADDLLALADAGKLGPVLVEQLRDWLIRHGSIASVTPVIDVARRDPVDRHDPPEWMDTQVRLRDGHCVFPHCQTTAWDADVDHITPYDTDGPPGQTHPDNLACLCRRHHLVKTHGRWSYVRNKDGTYLWSNHQHSRRWLVTPLGTITLP